MERKVEERVGEREREGEHTDKKKKRKRGERLCVISSANNDISKVCCNRYFTSQIRRVGWSHINSFEAVSIVNIIYTYSSVHYLLLALDPFCFVLLMQPIAAFKSYFTNWPAITIS